ncbi:hypothetical protein IFM89_010883 [Coptis chinensis]|uniref:Uncharacterized protein n=1 Tax=Coptis chinensis TaxID=261450 RepID=A0A835I1G3_9MAGN|nr:hypothetical protein IFM89_010883 [Coptis chinensis]
MFVAASPKARFHSMRIYLVESSGDLLQARRILDSVAALLKATHRDWSPARIKSAMMTTSYVVDHNGKQLVDDSTGDLATVLHYGSRHIDPDGNGNVPREFGGYSMRFQ